MIPLNNRKLLTPRMLRFLERQKITCKESTLVTRKIGLGHFCLFLKTQNKLLPKKLSHLLQDDLTLFVCHLNSMALAPYTKVNYLLNVRSYLAWEAEQNKINPDLLKVLDRNKLPRVPEYLPRPLCAENDRVLKDRFKKSNSPYALMFLLLRDTGLRISELINLPWNPIVTNDKNESFLKVPLGKMNNERMVPLHPATYEVIQEIKAAYPVCLGRCDKNRLIGIKGSGSAVRSHLYLHFKKFVSDITDQNKNVTFHRLRHSYATSLLGAGVSIVSIMKLLGHRRIEMSLRYAKITPSHLRDEFLKAIAVIENQTGIQKEMNHTIAEHQPAEIIGHLKAYTNQSAQIPLTQKKNIMRKLTRLKTDFEKISYRHPFKINTLKNHHS